MSTQQRKKLESMSTGDIWSLLESEGFSSDICDAFEEQEMDGSAISTTLATNPGPDCFKDVLPKLGQRVKVYKVLQSHIKAEYNEELEAVSVQPDITPPSSHCSRKSISGTSTEILSPEIFSPTSEVSSPSLEGISSSQHCGRKRTKSSPGSNSANYSDESLAGSSKNESGTVPDPFPIPRFRKRTQEEFDKKKLNGDDRKYVVSTLSTVLLTYVEKASMRDCLKVGEALVRKYPFLKEPHSWKNFIYVKCQNINRNPGKKSKTAEPPAKRPKTVNSAHNYPIVEDMEEDETSYKRNLESLKKELDSNRPSPAILKELMSRTFSWRRKWIVAGDVVSAHQIWTEFPLLKKTNIVEEEFKRIMKRPHLKSDFAENWDNWLTATIEYALSTRQPSVGLRHALRDLPSDTDEDRPAIDVHDWEKLTAFRCLGQYLILKKKSSSGKGSTSSNDVCDIPYILNICHSGTPPSECIDANNNLPHIVKLNNADYELRPQYFIALEQELIAETNTLVEAVYVLIAVHYIYNVVYHPRVRNLFLFLEEKILQLRSIDRSSKNANYELVVTGIESFLNVMEVVS